MSDEEQKSKTLRLAGSEEIEATVVVSRAEQAYDLMLGGMSSSDVAKELGYESGDSVTQAVRNLLKKDIADMDPDERRSRLAMEVARLDRLQQSIWQSALYGDPKAVDMALKIITTRVKIQGLDVADAQTGQNTVLVIGGQETDYIEQLKRATTDG